MKPKNWSREAARLGEVRIRKSGKSKVRMIKITHHGPKQKRWMEYARHWWLKNKGSIPEGMRVVHLDGNTLHDVPENYGLRTAGEVALLYIKNPKIREKMTARRAAATAESNRLRGGINRQLNTLPTYWYPVDFSTRTIINEPCKERWQVYEKYGVKARSQNGQGFIAAAIGWPDYSGGEALVLHAIASGSRTAREIADGVRQIAAHLDMMNTRRMYYLSFVYSTLCLLKKRGLVIKQSGGRRLSFYSLAEAAKPGPICPIVPIPGNKLLSAIQFATFKRSDAPKSQAVAA